MSRWFGGVYDFPRCFWCFGSRGEIVRDEVFKCSDCGAPTAARGWHEGRSFS